MAGTTTYYGISYPTSTDYVKDGAAAIQTVATGFDSAVAIPTYNAQTGATYTFVLADTGKTVTASNASAQTYTIPPTASVAWAANTTLRVLNLGAGTVTFAAGAGVTVTNTAQTLTQYQSANLVRTGLNAWTVTPDSGAASTSGLTLINTTTFSAVSSVSTPNSTFTATYDNYALRFNDITFSNTTGEAQVRMRAAGADYSGSEYRQQFMQSNSTTISGARTITTSFTSVAWGTTGTSFCAMEIQSPYLAKVTQAQYFTNFDTTANIIAIQKSASVNTTTVYDALTVIASAGTISGSMSIYGFNK